MTEIASPPIVTREEWLRARRELLEREKALTHEKDRVNALRRRLPMVKVAKPYIFDGPAGGDPAGQVSLAQLFDAKRQLIVYHFMFDPSWDKGCPGCTGLVDAMGNLDMLAERDTRFVLISRAPLAKLERYRQARGWSWPWYSSFGTDFNYDFHATHDESVRPPEHNFMSKAEVEAKTGKPWNPKGETHALSVFFRLDGTVYHTYSAFARGVESLTDSYSLLDCTPWGRQEDFEDSPDGWPQKPTYG